MHTQQLSKHLDVLALGLEDGVDYRGALGILTVFGPTAFPVLVGTYGHDGSRQPIAAASQFGEGRVVAFAHDCYVFPNSAKQKTLLQNCVNWVTVEKTLKPEIIRVGLLPTNEQLDAWGSNFKVTPLLAKDITRVGLTNVDVLILVDHELFDTPEKVSLVKSFVRRGGGLVTAATGWAFEQKMEQHPLNQICYEAGFGWTKNNSIKPIEPDSNLFSFNVENLQDTHAGDVWKILQAKHEHDFDFEESRMKQMKSVIELAKSNLPPTHPLLVAIEKKQVVLLQVEDLKVLLDGLEKSGVEKAGSVGVMSVYGPNAFTLLPGKYTTDGTRHAIGAAARYGDGKMVGFAHDCFTYPTETSRIRLLTNCVRWAAPETALTEGVIRVALLGPGNRFNIWKSSNEKNFKVTEFGNSTMLVEKLEEIDVILLALVSYLSDLTHIQLVKQFVKSGGGLVTAATSWAYEDNLKTVHPGNLLSRDAGFAWTSNFSLIPIEADSRVFSTALTNFSDTHARAGWDLFCGALNNAFVLPPQRMAQLGSVMNFALDVAYAPERSTFLTMVQTDLENTADVIPSESCVITTPTDKFKLKFQVDFKYNLESYGHNLKGSCHPATKFFPGLPSPDAARESNHLFKITATANARYSTGVYAPPGEKITFTLSKALTTRITLQIGCHSDNLTKCEKWYRCPVLIVQKDLAAGATELNMSNTFGGLVYIVTNADESLPYVIEGSISGTILAPHFILGETTLEEWEIIRTRPTPWGELETKKIILTLPGPQLAEVDNPVELMEFWDQVLDAQADLAGVPLDRPRAERMVADVQISAGYMHAGYPVMILTDSSVDVALSIGQLKSSKAWGHYHELGHNLQVPSWNFQYVGEVSNNVFVLYVFEKVCGITFAEARSDKFTPEEMKKAIELYAINSPNYNIWGDDPFVGLLFYAQLQRKYGWDAYKKVFRSYQTLTPLPSTQQEKIDVWLIQFSTIVQENLSSLFKAWGIPVSDEAANSLAHLPPTDQTLFSLVEN